MEWAAAGFASFTDLRRENTFQIFNFVAGREREKRLVAGCTVSEITLEHALDKAWRVLRFHIAVDLAAQGSMRPEAATDVNVIALDLLLTLFDLAGKQTYVADRVLRARMMAPREVNIHATVQHASRFTPVRDVLGMALGIGRREAAADIACTGDEPGTDRACFRGQPERIDRSFGISHLSVWHARYQKVLPDRKPDIAVAELLRDPRQATHLRRRDPRDGQDDADPVETLLFLGVHADVGTAIKIRTWQDRVRRHFGQFAAECFFDVRDVFFEAPGVEHVFKPRLVAVGAIAVRDVYTYDGIGDLCCFIRSDDHTCVPGEILVAGNAAKRETKPHARLGSETGLHFDRLKSNVVGILKHRDTAGPVESDIEFARQAIQRAFVENVEVPLARVRARIDQFIR